MDKKGRSFLNIIQDDLDSYKLFLPLKVFISFTKVHDLHVSIYLSIWLVFTSNKTMVTYIGMMDFSYCKM